MPATQLRNTAFPQGEPPFTGVFDERASVAVIATELEAIEAAHQLAEEIGARAANRDHEGEPPLFQLERASSLGLTGILVPRAFGGLEASSVTIAEVIRVISAVDPNVGQILIAQYTLGDLLRTNGNKDQKEFFFSRILKGARIGNALTEAKTKSAGEIQTRLRKAKKGGFLLSGEKFYTTGSYLSHWFPVSALDDDGNVAFAYISRASAGLDIRDDWRGFGQKGTLSGTAIFNDIAVPDFFIVRPQGEPSPHSGNTFAQLFHAAVDVGIATGALDEAAYFLNHHARAWPEGGVERAAQEPHVIRSFGELKVQELAAEALLGKAARIMDQLRRHPADKDLQTEAILAVAAARAAADAAVLNITSEIFHLGGARSSLEKWNLDRFWRNARTHTVHDPIRWQYHHIGDYHLNQVEPVDSARLRRRSA